MDKLPSQSDRNAQDIIDIIDDTIGHAVTKRRSVDVIGRTMQDIESIAIDVARSWKVADGGPSNAHSRATGGNDCEPGEVEHRTNLSGMQQ